MAKEAITFEYVQKYAQKHGKTYMEAKKELLAPKPTKTAKDGDSK